MLSRRKSGCARLRFWMRFSRRAMAKKTPTGASTFPRKPSPQRAVLTSGDGEEAAIGHIYMLAKTFRQMLVILERNVRDQRMLWAALWQGFRVPPVAADDIIKQARRYKSRRELTRAIRLVAKADLALRSNPVSKRMVLERLVLDLTTEPKPEAAGWLQEQLPV